MPMTFDQKMCRAVELGFKKLENNRKARYRMLSHYVGPFFSKTRMGGTDEERKASPINLLHAGVTTMVPNLVFNDPKLLISTNILAYRDYAGVLEAAANDVISGRLRLRKTLRKVMVDALFMCGVMKVGICPSNNALMIDGKQNLLGEIYADRVDFDDFVFDPMARDEEEWVWVGNRMRVRKEKALMSGMFDNALIEKLCSRYREGDYKNEASNLSGDGRIAEDYQEVEEYIDLTEVYLPAEQVVLTLPYGDYGGNPRKILRTASYEGPERGPYHLLGFAWVPDNVLPVPSASIWFWLHVLGNRVARKLARQAERNKRVLAYQPTSFDDAKALVEADDGETVEVEDINGIKEVNYGGMTDEAQEFMVWVQGQFSRQAGNIDLLAGVDADAPTATQSEQLQTNANIKVSDAQEQVYHFTGEVGRDVTFYIHTDPLYEESTLRRIQGQDVQVTYTPEMRRGRFLDYACKIKPYSMGRQDPNIQLKRLMEFLGNGIPAMAQAIQLLGPAFKIENALKIVGQKMGIDELDELIDSQLLIQQMLQRAQMVPPDGKAPGAAAPGFAGAGAGGAVPGGIRPQQPNPMAAYPQGGVMPDTERNMAQQETAGEIQSTY